MPYSVCNTWYGGAGVGSSQPSGAAVRWANARLRAEDRVRGRDRGYLAAQRRAGVHHLGAPGAGRAGNRRGRCRRPEGVRDHRGRARRAGPVVRDAGAARGDSPPGAGDQAGVRGAVGRGGRRRGRAAAAGGDGAGAAGRYPAEGRRRIRRGHGLAADARRAGLPGRGRGALARHVPGAAREGEHRRGHGPAASGDPGRTCGGTEQLMTVLDIDRAGRVFGSGHLRVVALDNVSLRVRVGEFVAVMGPSGSGKSTLLRLAGGLDRPTCGRVLLSGRDLTGLDEAGLAAAWRRQVGFVFQEANLLASLTAAENVALVLELDGVRPRAAMAGARGLLDSLGLGAVGGRFPGQLSGGEQQRVAIARAVAGGRSLLLADEPTGALDALTGESVMGLLRQGCATGGAVVLATHNVRHAAWADRVVFLNDGRLAGETGPPAGPECLLGAGQVR